MNITIQICRHIIKILDNMNIIHSIHPIDIKNENPDKTRNIFVNFFVRKVLKTNIPDIITIPYLRHVFLFCVVKIKMSRYKLSFICDFKIFRNVS